MEAIGRDSLTFYPSDIHVERWDESLTLFVSFSLISTARRVSDYVWRSPEALLSFDGFPYCGSFEPEASRAEMMLQQWRSDEHLIDTMSGTWAALRHGRDGGKALGDFTGMTPLFYAANAEYLAISPRQMLISSVTGRRLDLNLQNLAWLTGQANVMGEDSVWDGIKLLPPHWTLAWSGDRGDVTPRFTEREIWQAPEHLDEARPSEIAQRLVAQADALERLDLPPFSMDITGGLDSRLAAAIVCGSRLAGRVERMQTRGPENGHEIQVGREVARQLGMDHVEITPSPKQLNPQQIFTELRSSMFRYEATICPSDGLTGAAQMSRFVVSGSAGELYRRHCKPHMNVELQSIAELETLFADYHQTTDPLGIERSEVRDFQRRDLQNRALEFHRQGAGLNDVTDVFFLRYRLPLWNGVLQNNLFNQVKIYPLLDYRAACRAQNFDYKDRVEDRLHFELMAEINPRLCELPFYKFTWPRRFKDLPVARQLELPAHPFKTVGEQNLSQLSVGSKMRVLIDQHWEHLRSYMLDPVSSRIWEVLDRTAVEHLFERNPATIRKVTETKQIMAMLGLQVVLTGDMLARMDGAPGTQVRLHGAAAQQMFGHLNPHSRLPAVSFPEVCTRLESTF